MRDAARQPERCDTSRPFLLYESGSLWLPEGIGVRVAPLEGFAPWDEFSRKYMGHALLVELPQDTLLIGRVRVAGAALLLIQDGNVSKRHAAVEWRDGRHWLRDLGSTCGTPVNGRKRAAPHPLAAGDQISVGGYVDRRLIYVDPASPAGRPPYLDPALARLAGAPGAAGAPR